MKKIVVIPARLNSTRLPNKVLLDLKGKTVIHRVYEQCAKAKNIDEIYIATDSIKVKNSCEKFTTNVLLTATSHQTGTDRIAEAIANIECDIVINVQGDEPFIDPTLIERLADSFNSKTVMASAMHKIDNISDLKDPNIVKVTVNCKGNALYFSRSIIPFHRDTQEKLLKKTSINHLGFFKHIGVYGYKKDFLLKLSTMKPTPLEEVEHLEQLRVIESGYKIKMIQTNCKSIGIDTKKDYETALGLFA